jgi:predicted Rdx family selenoprotein
MAEIMGAFEPGVDQITLIPGDGGCFELVIDGKTLYSKLAEHRHMEEGEATRLIRTHLSQR